MTKRLEAIVFDWAGTVVDFGSRAPVLALVAAFQKFGVKLSQAEARGPMGLAKWDHVLALFESAAVGGRWRSVHGRFAARHDMEGVYAAFAALIDDKIRECALLVPGAADLARSLRAQGLKIGTTTGYSRASMADLARRAAEQGFAPDCMISTDEVAHGRPAPDMMHAALRTLGVGDARLAVKVDDTVPGLLEGSAGGAWTIGVALSGNAAGLAFDDLRRLPAARRAELSKRACEELAAARPDFVVETVADLPPVLAEIETRLARGQSPGR